MKILFFSFCLLCSQFVSASNLMLAEQIMLNSNALGEQRSLLIKLPKQYHQSKHLYPVLYVLHAQWDMLSTLSTLDLLEDEVPEFIVIGVEGKGKELSPDNGNVTPFASFLTKEVVPFVEKNYRVAPYSILTGHSNSGRFVLDLWLNNTSPFSQFFAFSPSLDDGYIVNRLSDIKNTVLSKNAPLIVTLANEGEHMQQPYAELTEKLSTVSKDLFKFKKFPNQSHRTTKHSSMQFAMQTAFTGWEPSYEIKVSGLAGLQKHYVDLSKKFGFQVFVPKETLQRLTAHYAISKDNMAVTELKKHVQFTIEQTSDGLDSMLEISDYLSSNGYKEAGENILKEICNFAKNNQRCAS